MNRMLKFRAWNGEKMLYPKDAHQGAGSGTFVLLMDMEGKTSWNNPWGLAPEYRAEVELMQYAGFTDKNGKDVYEGDIVAAWSQGSKGVFQIKWRQEASPCWLLYPNGQHNQMWHISATEHRIGKQFIDVTGKVTISDKDCYIDDGLEIIGNIYENPELIK